MFVGKDSKGRQYEAKSPFYSDSCEGKPGIRFPFDVHLSMGFPELENAPKDEQYLEHINITLKDDSNKPIPLERHVELLFKQIVHYGIAGLVSHIKAGEIVNHSFVWIYFDNDQLEEFLKKYSAS